MSKFFGSYQSLNLNTILTKHNLTMSANLLKQIWAPYKLVENLRFAIFSHQMFNFYFGYLSSNENIRHPIKMSSRNLLYCHLF